MSYTIQKNLEPFFGQKKIMFFAKMYASGPFSCRISTSKGVRPITVVNVCWDQTSDPILQYMEAEKYHQVIHEKELRSAFKALVELLAVESETYEGLVRLRERNII